MAKPAKAPAAPRAPKPPKPPKPKPNPARTRLYRAVLAACLRIGLDDDERKAVQADLTGKASMTDMTIDELARLLDQLNRNWSGPMAHRPHIGKIKALWWSLYWLGEVDSAEDWAISAFVKRQTGMSSIRFLSHTKAPAVIEALKSWLERAGVEWPAAERSQPGQSATPGSTTARAERLAVLDAIGGKLYDRGVLDGDWAPHIVRQLGLSPSYTSWTEAELDAAIRCLGMLGRGEG